MDYIEQKVKHLEFIQVIVNRMASNYFLIKGWCVTLVTAIFVLADKDMNPKFIIITYLSVIVFWILDGYYLYQERLFRALYNDVRIKNQTDFSMNTTPFEGGKNTWIVSMFSKTLNIFYIALIVVVLIIIYIIK